MSSLDVQSTFAFDPVPSGTLIRCSWELKPGLLRLITPLVAYMSRRQEEATCASLKQVMQAREDEAMSSAVFVTDPTHVAHVAPGHPERPERLEAIVAQLVARDLRGRMLERPPREATDEELLTVHEAALIATVEWAAARGASL